MENEKDLLKVPVGAIIAPIVGMQIFIGIMLFFGASFVFSMLDYSNSESALATGIVLTIVLFPEFWLLLPRKIFQKTKIGLLPRIFPYSVWFFVIFLTIPKG